MQLVSTSGKSLKLFDPHKLITNYLKTDFPAIPQFCSDEGLALETSATHYNPQAKNIPYQPLLIKPVFPLTGTFLPFYRYFVPLHRFSRFAYIWQFIDGYHNKTGRSNDWNSVRDV